MKSFEKTAWSSTYYLLISVCSKDTVGSNVSQNSNSNHISTWNRNLWQQI